MKSLSCLTSKSEIDKRNQKSKIMHVSIGSHIKKILWNYLQIEIYIEMELKSESEIETQYGAACQRQISNCRDFFLKLFENWKWKVNEK